MKRIYKIGIFWLLCFVLGSYVRKILNTGDLFLQKVSENITMEDLDYSVSVGDYLVTQQDIEWEYDYYIRLSHRVGGKAAGEGIGLEKRLIVELYNKILADLIERKLLYQFISKDTRFDVNEVSRFTKCLEQWTLTINEHQDLFDSEKARVHLKSMLCEKEILQQYVEERIVRNIRLSDEELRNYYYSHRSEFQIPARVVIRQIVLASESEAKKVRVKVNAQNFASLAKDLSITPEAEDGGKLGPFAKGDMLSVFDVAFEMSQGEIQGILKSPYGFHIIMLERKSPKAEQGFDAAKSRISERLLAKRKEEEYKKWVGMALNSIPIKSSRTL